MPDIVLAAESKRATGSSNSRRLRHTGRVPAVVYGHGIEATSISVDARQLRSALSTSAGTNVVLELDIDGEHHMAMAKVVDHHPVRHTVSHVDFLVVNRNEKVTADVPLSIVGEAEAVARDGGVVEQSMHSITLTMLPGQIPDAIEVDVTNLQPGGFIRISDLTLPKGVETDLDPETPVVGAAHASEVGEVPAPADGATPEAEGEGADGEAAPAAS
ncbi:MAG: 50S ribosomal protein L25/general stress protein Ctc [Acidimicrobiales bacterium]